MQNSIALPAAGLPSARFAAGVEHGANLVLDPGVGDRFSFSGIRFRTPFEVTTSVLSVSTGNAVASPPRTSNARVER